MTPPISTTNHSNDNNQKSPSSAATAAFIMPAEWAPHEATLIVMPHCPFVFRVEKAEREFLTLAQAIATTSEAGGDEERVVLFCQDNAHADRIRRLITKDSSNNNIHVCVCPTDDSWARDMGPTFVVNAANVHATGTPPPQQQRCIVGLDWIFNAWGGPDEGCYWPCEQDQKAAAIMCQEMNRLLGTPQQPPQQEQQQPVLTTRKVPLVLEGGSIHVDGEGTVLTTKECLLNPNRNPDQSQADIERTVLEALGGTKMIWLPHGVDGDDDTNGHVDNFACFGPQPGHIILSWTDDNISDKVNYDRCRQALALLERDTDARGRSWTIHKLPLPSPPLYYTQDEVDSLALYQGEPARQVGERMAASYVNFYIANKAVVVPQFGLPETDAQAIQILTNLFPERNVVGVYSKEVLIGGGNLHCITQQVPKV